MSRKPAGDSRPPKDQSESFGTQPGPKPLAVKDADAPSLPSAIAGLLSHSRRHSLHTDSALSAPIVVDVVGEGHPLIAILGPTASGKSALALFLAERLGGEVVNYDSVQVFRGFSIGSGKVSLRERRGIPHHLIDFVEPSRVFTAGDYRQAALAVLNLLRERKRLPVLVGGTGLYLRALLLGLFQGPSRSEDMRARLRALRERRGREFLHRLLRRLDPASAARIQPFDTQKTIRAIEVCVLAHQPMSQVLARGREGLKGFRVFKIGLNAERARLNERINQRVEWMFANGLLDETRAAIDRPDAAEVKPLGALGFRQAWSAFRGEISIGQAIRDTQTATRHYAKRQMTWFRREPEVTWFGGFGDSPETQRQVLDWLGLMGLESLRPAQAADLRASIVEG